MNHYAKRITRCLMLGSLLLFSTATTVFAQNCFRSTQPAATLPGQPAPVFCTNLGTGPDTSRGGRNTWFDDFNHGLSMSSFAGTRYQVFEAVDGVYRSRHWRHADHWMVDVAPDSPNARYDSAGGGSMIRPNRRFRFNNRKLVVEATYAAGHEDYLNLRGWGELVITTAPAPGGYRRGGVYAYEMFPGHYTLGCRLQGNRNSVCSLMDDSENSALDNGREWEMSFFQHVGTRVFGGEPSGARGRAWRVCKSNSDPDSACRDHFRLELTPTSLRISVNGVRYFQQTGIPRLPGALLRGPVYVYFASIVGRSDFDVVRFHWDKLAVNPR